MMALLMLLLTTVKSATLIGNYGVILAISIMKRKRRPRKKNRASLYNTLLVRYGLLLRIKVRARFPVAQLQIPLEERPLVDKSTQSLVAVYCPKEPNRKSSLVVWTPPLALRPLAPLEDLIIGKLLIKYQNKYRLTRSTL